VGLIDHSVGLIDHSVGLIDHSVGLIQFGIHYVYEQARAENVQKGLRKLVPNRQQWQKDTLPQMPRG